jgi:hypothetical protein
MITLTIANQGRHRPLVLAVTKAKENKESDKH